MAAKSNSKLDDKASPFTNYSTKFPAETVLFQRIKTFKSDSYTSGDSPSEDDPCLIYSSEEKTCFVYSPQRSEGGQIYIRKYAAKASLQIYCNARGYFACYGIVNLSEVVKCVFIYLLVYCSY